VGLKSPGCGSDDVPQFSAKVKDAWCCIFAWLHSIVLN